MTARLVEACVTIPSSGTTCSWRRCESADVLFWVSSENHFAVVLLSGQSNVSASDEYGVGHKREAKDVVRHTPSRNPNGCHGLPHGCVQFTSSGVWACHG